MTLIVACTIWTARVSEEPDSYRREKFDRAEDRAVAKNADTAIHKNGLLKLIYLCSGREPGATNGHYLLKNSLFQANECRRSKIKAETV